MRYNFIKIQKKQALAWLIMNRPKKRNALNRETLAELHHGLVTLEQDPSVRVVILTGAGDQAFVAGADIAELANLNSEQAKDLGVKDLIVFLLLVSKVDLYRQYF